MLNYPQFEGQKNEEDTDREFVSAKKHPINNAPVKKPISLSIHTPKSSVKKIKLKNSHKHSKDILLPENDDYNFSPGSRERNLFSENTEDGSKGFATKQ